MGFMDKVKATVKSGAEQAAAKAQEELERMQAKRDLADAYEELGRKAYELADRGELSHGDLTGPVSRVRDLRTELDSIGADRAGTPAAEGQAGQPTPDQQDR